MQDMLSRIKQGVSLKPVTAEEKKQEPDGAASFHAALQARFEKMNAAAEDSDSDDGEGEW